MYIYYVVCYNYLPSHLWELALFSLTLRVEVWITELDWPRHFLFSYRGGMVGGRVLEGSNLSLSVISLLDFRNVTAVWWFCFVFCFVFLFFLSLPFRLIFVFDNITTWITLFHRLRLKEYEVYIYIYEADSFSYVISGDENVISDLHLVYLSCGLNFNWNGAH